MLQIKIARHLFLFQFFPAQLFCCSKEHEQIDLEILSIFLRISLGSRLLKKAYFDTLLLYNNGMFDYFFTTSQFKVNSIFA